jgi:acyl-CoA thioesterase
VTTPARPDTFAALLGITVTRLGSGRTESALTVGPDHLNPHGTAHGALLYSLAGVALAAAANDDEHSGVVSAVHIDYLHPALLGDALVARAELAERLDREDLFQVRVLRAADDQVIARLSGRATRRRHR